jgi:hypothetical protein
MKVFISWSGVRSNALADALRDWIPLVLHYVEPWLSQTDIEAGQRWAEQVAKELESSNFGILCITQDNLTSPWVLFEAGALAKSLQGSRVIPFLLDLEFRDVTGPLAQFQAKKVDRTGVFEVIQSLNQLAPHPVPENRVKQLFDALWQEFEKKVASIPRASAIAKHARPQSEILEELVAGIRSLDSKFREVAEDGPRGIRSRSRRFHPGMLHELSDLLREKPGDPIILLMLSSMFREDMPWLYELGMEAYRSAKNGTPSEATAARKRFQKAAELMRRGPFGAEEFGFDPHTIRMMVREMDHLLHFDAAERADAEAIALAEFTDPSAQKWAAKKSGKQG